MIHPQLPPIPFSSVTPPLISLFLSPAFSTFSHVRPHLHFCCDLVHLLASSSLISHRKTFPLLFFHQLVRKLLAKLSSRFVPPASFSSICLIVSVSPPRGMSQQSPLPIMLLSKWGLPPALQSVHFGTSKAAGCLILKPRPVQLNPKNTQKPPHH